MQGLNLPQHIAIIMDGNGRWAQRRRKPRIFGHQEGAKRVREVVEAAGEIGVKALTLFAFSEENWARPEDEISGLFGLLRHYLETEIENLHKKNVRLKIIGNVARLPESCRKLLIEGIRRTSGNSGLVLNIALSYSGRTEIVDAARQIAKSVQAGDLVPEDIDANLFASFMTTSDLPDPDLLIRTSGEQRISNFLLWQCAYTELYFSDLCWPDFRRSDLMLAIESFSSRHRRFGKIDATAPQISMMTEPC
jgi:undecaprenyl diphosphate synthase